MSALTADLGAFAAASRKEWRVLRRYPSVFASVLVWPLVLPGVYVLQAQAFGARDPRALDAFASRAGTAEVAGFLYVGGAVYMWLSVILWGPGTSLRKEQLQGSLETLFLTPATRLAFLFGPTPAHLAQTLWMFAVVVVALALGFGTTLTPDTIVRALAVVAVATPALVGIGGVFAAAVLLLREARALVQVVRTLFQVFCGMTFPVVVLPEWARVVAALLPPTYVLADLRAALLASVGLRALLPDLIVLAASGAVLCLAAVAMLSWIEQRARRRGGLAHY